MADEEPKKKPFLYGSAGMAASGMMPGLRRRKAPEPESPKSLGKITDEPEPDDTGPTDEMPSGKPAQEEEKRVPVPPPPAYEGLRAAVIGHTGEGGFGSHLDVVFQHLDGVRLFAVCDGKEGAVDETLIKTGAPGGYSDFREMLETESPDLVSVATRWSSRHAEVIRAALESGAHVLCEPPFTRILKEADELVDLAREKNLTIAMASPMRCDPHVLRFLEEREELIGDLLEIHLFGRMDQSSGGEDLLLSGAPLFDLARLVAGEPSYCTATVTCEGCPAIAEDAHELEGDPYGPLLGDTIRAQFVMESGVFVTFVSDPRARAISGPSGIEFVGQKGKMRLFVNQPPIFSRLTNSTPGSHTRSEVWQLWPRSKGPYHPPVEKLTQLDAANRLLVRDWLDAIETGRPPRSSGDDGRKALEMVHGVWQAATTMKRAYFPLVNRLHPLIEEVE